MLTRFRIRPIVVAIAGGIVLSFAAFSGLAALRHTAAGSGDVISQPAMVQRMQETPMAMPLAVRTLAKVSRVNESANSTPAGAPLPIVHPPAQPSQLIRTSTLGMEVKDVSRAVHVATGIVAGELGDVVNLDYRAAGATETPKTATLEVRVPQYRFH
ncbi:MAG: DUF4349 domain-containing protein, partial [Candidatus Eremiobacteraeota bacterium]|nr:DUF4349 domain-containing protein [Candidatus Eremiobacteraeota bacterium]